MAIDQIIHISTPTLCIRLGEVTRLQVFVLVRVTIIIIENGQGYKSTKLCRAFIESD